MKIHYTLQGEKMNIYDTKTISCKDCGKSIGEIEYDAEVILPQCGHCANPLPEGDDILYTASHFKNNPPLKKPMIIESLTQ